MTVVPRVRVLCIDELGPLSAKTYPGEEWQPGPYRATFEPDYGRRGVLWVHGAFEPATGEATILLSPRRDGATHIQLLERIVTTFPADRWLIIEDNLITPVSTILNRLRRNSVSVVSQVSVDGVRQSEKGQNLSLKLCQRCEMNNVLAWQCDRSQRDRFEGS